MSWVLFYGKFIIFVPEKCCDLCRNKWVFDTIDKNGLKCMNEMIQINGESLISELVGSLVDEKSDLHWVMPFSEENHNLIVDELFAMNPISEV